MSRTFTLVDALALADLHVFLGRAQRVDDGAVRIIAGSGVLAVYVSVLYPVGLLDNTPTVLGLRTFAADSDDAFDAIVSVRTLLERVELLVESTRETPLLSVTVSLPNETKTATWAAISPPRGGWVSQQPIASTVVDRSAREGIDEVAAAVPTGTGEQIVHKVRSGVWSRSIEGDGNIPAGATFAALSLGFLHEEDTVAVFESGVWTRLSTRRGHVLVKRRAGSQPS
jgi:hypothetical protein